MMHFSASQVATYELCARKWAWGYIDNIKGEPHPSATFGLDVHGRLEQWLTSRKIPKDDKAGKLAHVMLRHLPTPQSVDPKNVELGFRVMLGKHWFNGFVDLFKPVAVLPIVYDHKTTSDERWAKQSDDLVTDIQATLYAFWAFIRMKKENPKEVLLQWTYGKTKGAPKAWSVCKRVTKADVEPRLLATIESADEMALIKAGVEKAIEVPYEATACEAFGGCPHRERCNLTAKERVSAIMSQGEKSLFLRKLQERKAAKEAGGNGAAAVNPPESAAEAPQPVAEAAPSPAPSDEKAKRKRRTKAEMAAAKAAEKAGAATAASTEAVDGWILYINCAPIKGGAQPVNAEEILATVLGELQSEHQLAHYKLIEFGKGPGLFLEAVNAYLRDNPPANGVVLNTGCPEAIDARLAFVNSAAVVIQG